MTKSINIVSRSNGVGLDQDVRLIKETLEAAGYTVNSSHCRAIPPWSKFTTRDSQYNLNIFLERTFSRWFKKAQCNILIPNQERYPLRHLNKLKSLHSVLCKTHHAHGIFSKYAPSSYIGFSSPDRYDFLHSIDYSKFLHLAGKSTLKGTEDILNLWEKHPEWPTLTLVQHASNAPAHTPDNVHLITEYISNQQLAELLNTHGIHICPSRSEGWGHYITEAMSCSAVVVTTDAPPMNELVQKGRGVLVTHKNSEPRHLGTNFYIDPSELESAIETLINMPTSQKLQVGSAARHWFDANDKQFREKLPRVIGQILENEQ